MNDVGNVDVTLWNPTGTSAPAASSHVSHSPLPPPEPPVGSSPSTAMPGSMNSTCSPSLTPISSPGKLKGRHSTAGRTSCPSWSCIGFTPKLPDDAACDPAPLPVMALLRGSAARLINLVLKFFIPRPPIFQVLHSLPYPILSASPDFPP